MSWSFEFAGNEISRMFTVTILSAMIKLHPLSHLTGTNLDVSVIHRQNQFSLIILI